MVKNGMKLVRKDGTEVNIGDTLIYSDGSTTTCQGGAPPLHSGSSGRVWVGKIKTDREYYPSVFGLEWVKDSA